MNPIRADSWLQLAASGSPEAEGLYAAQGKSTAFPSRLSALETPEKSKALGVVTHGLPL